MCLVLVILVVLLHIYLQSGIKEKKDTRRKKKEGEEKRTRPEARRPMHATTPSIDH